MTSLMTAGLVDDAKGRRGVACLREQPRYVSHVSGVSYFGNKTGVLITCSQLLSLIKLHPRIKPESK